MLRKLLKYDLKAMLKIWWIPAAVFGVVTVGACICALLLNYHADYLMGTADSIVSDWGELQVTIAILGLFLSFLVFSLFSVSGTVIPAIRYYKNFFTDEAYLTFTLPAKNSTVLKSKIISSFLLAFFVLALQTLALLAVGLCLMRGEALGDFLQSVMALSGIYEYVWDGPWYWMVLNILVELSVILLRVLTWQLAFTLGGTKGGKNKILASIGFYFLLSAGVSAASGAVSLLYWLQNFQAALSVQLISSLLLPLICLISNCILSFGLYMINVHSLEKKLNLV